MTEREQALLREYFDKITDAKKMLLSPAAIEFTINEPPYICVKTGIEDIAEAYGEKLETDTTGEKKVFINGVRVVQFAEGTKVIRDYV